MSFYKIFKETSWQDIGWNSWCILSVIGIWPRFIEPQYLTLRSLTLPIPNLPKDLEGIKILHFSDLHWNHCFSSRFMKKISSKIKTLKPDLIVFTGDFLCRARLEDPERLSLFLAGFQAPLGCYAILGNHDYDAFVSINEQGEYDTDQKPSQSVLRKCFSRLFQKPISLTKIRTHRACAVKPHSALVHLLKQTPFQLLENETIQIKIKNSYFNLCGLGDYMTGNFTPEKAFENYKTEFPGIILSHNPDSLVNLMEFPGELVLSGHTHGGQINLPWFHQKFTVMENPKWKTGLIKSQKKLLYVNRGLGGIFPFRWFSPPELSLFTLTRAPSCIPTS